MSNIQLNLSQPMAKMQLEAGASHQTIESFIVSVNAQLSADAKYAPALPAIANSRLPINPEHAPLSGEHWMVSPSFIDDHTRMSRGTPLTITQYREELAREIEEAELVAHAEAEIAAAEAAVVEVAKKKRKRRESPGSAGESLGPPWNPGLKAGVSPGPPIPLKSNGSAATPVRGGLAGLGTLFSPVATTPSEPPTSPRTPFRATIIDAYQSQMSSSTSQAGTRSPKLEKILTTVRTDQIKAYIAIVPAVITLITSNLSLRTIYSLSSNAEWIQAVGRQDLVRLWYVLLRHVTFFYTTPEMVITCITSELQNKPEYKLAKDEPFIDYANRWTAALKHILFADHQFKQAAIVIHFIRGIPATHFQQLRRELVDPRTYPSPHLDAARNSLALCINEFVREIQMQRQLEPIQAAPNDSESDAKRILKLMASNEKLQRRVSQLEQGSGGGAHNANIECINFSRQRCTRGDSCKYKHGKDDTRWNGDTMKPEALAIVKKSIERAATKKLEREQTHTTSTVVATPKKVNYLAQQDITGTEA